MGFELTVRRNNPLTGEDDLDQALLTFLEQIGYLHDGSVKDAGFRLFRDCFLLNPERPWTVNDLLTHLHTNKSTLYRYLNKLKGLDILDEVDVPADAPSEDVSYRKMKKGYRFRFKSLSTAWGIVESHTNVALDSYRKSVDHLDSLAKNAIKGTDSGPGRKKPSITVDGVIINEGRILLINRGHEPYRGMWALPGGFIEYGEKAEDAVVREIEEETGLKCNVDEILSVASRPNRDPRGHTISIVYGLSMLEKDEPEPGDDAARTEWFPLDDLPELAFDHSEIIKGLHG